MFHVVPPYTYRGLVVPMTSKVMSLTLAIDQGQDWNLQHFPQRVQRQMPATPALTGRTLHKGAPTLKVILTLLFF